MIMIGTITKNLNVIKSLMKIYAKFTSVLYKHRGREKLKKVKQKYQGKTLNDFEKWFNSKHRIKV